MRLSDKTAVITGAARGIGLAIARHFRDEGCNVILTDIDTENGQRKAEALSCHFLSLDVRSENDWEALASFCPSPDIVVNNAGITGFENGVVAHDPEHATLADWHAVHRTNLDGTFLGCRYALRGMGPRGTGSIINISSRSGLVGIPGAAAYASSKAAILTPMWEAMLGGGPDRETRMKALVADTPLKRFGTVDEVAAICVMLASDEVTYITGSEFSIDGGLLAGSAAVPG